MKEIRMVDLKSQYLKIKNEVDNAILEVIDTTAFINGPEVKNFQNELAEYLGVKHVIACGNGTDALQIALMSLGLKPGDEVITSDFTFVASVEVIALLGLTPILVDVDPDTFNLSTSAIENAITDKTKAIIPVHVFGQCADMDEIMTIAEKHNLYVVEDTAQATGAEYTSADGKIKKAGTIGHIGCTSFFPSKNLGCFGDGGAMFTNDDKIAEKLRIMSNHGMHIRYYHDSVGVNSRLDSIQAAILRIKLRHLDTYNQNRFIAAEFYNNAFKNSPKLKTPVQSSKSNHIYHQYTLVLSDVNREELQKFLNSKGIPAMIYYPVPLHSQKAYTNDRYKEENFKITNKLCETVVSLPIHTELDNEQLQHITSSVLEFVNA